MAAVTSDFTLSSVYKLLATTYRLTQLSQLDPLTLFCFRAANDPW